MEVLQESITQQVVVRSCPNYCRDSFETGLSAGSPAPLTRNEFISLPHGTNDHWLEQADLFDGIHEFGKSLFVEDLTGLLGVRNDRI
jgi:hypothetical protein